MLLKVFLYDNGIYTKKHFNSSLVEVIKELANDDGIKPEVRIDEYDGTPAKEWLDGLDTSSIPNAKVDTGAYKNFAWAIAYTPEQDEKEEDLILSLRIVIEYCRTNMDASGEVHSHIIEKYVSQGVEFIDGNNTYIDKGVIIAPGVTIYPNVYLEGDVSIDEGTIIYPGCRIQDSRIGKNCTLEYVKAKDAVVGDGVTIGPYVNLRPGTVIADECKIGDFVEVKNSNVGRGTKLPHLSYIGDADVGERVNVGCGTVFVNYDGKNKHRTTVGNDVFLGCNTNLVAPISVADGAYTAAGSTITDDVPNETLAIARAKQVNKTGWVPPKKR